MKSRKRLQVYQVTMNFVIEKYSCPIGEDGIIYTENEITDKS